MKFLLISCFCLLSIVAKADWYTYMYAGDKRVKSQYYERVNTVPILIDFIEAEACIRVNCEGQNNYFYVVKMEEVSRNELRVTTVTSDGDKVMFYVTNLFTIFIIDDIAFVITNVHQSDW